MTIDESDVTERDLSELDALKPVLPILSFLEFMILILLALGSGFSVNVIVTWAGPDFGEPII